MNENIKNLHSLGPSPTDAQINAIVSCVKIYWGPLNKTARRFVKELWLVMKHDCIIVTIRINNISLRGSRFTVAKEVLFSKLCCKRDDTFFLKILLHKLSSPLNIMWCAQWVSLMFAISRCLNYNMLTFFNEISLVISY